MFNLPKLYAAVTYCPANMADHDGYNLFAYAMDN